MNLKLEKDPRIEMKSGLENLIGFVSKSNINIILLIASSS